MNEITSTYLKIGSATIFVGIAIIAVTKIGTITNVEIAAPTTTPILAASFKEDEITKVGELRYNGSAYIGDVYVRYTDKRRNIFSDAIVSREENGKNIILYRLNKEGFFKFGEPDVSFNEKEFGGFLGYITPLMGNDFFVVQYLGADKTKISDLLVVYWDPNNKQFQATTTIPKAVLDVLHSKQK